MKIHLIVRTIAAFFFLLSYGLWAGTASSPTLESPSGKEELVAQWKAAATEHRPWDDRRGICAEVEPFIKKGMSREEAQELLGKPQSERKGEEGVLWTYVLYWGQYLQVIINATDEVEEFRRYPGAGENGRDLKGDIGVWQSLPNFYDVRSGADKKKEGANIARSLQPGTEGGVIRDILGAADHESSSGENRIWVYALAADSFLELVFDGQGRMVTAQARNYPRDGVEPPQIAMLVGDASKVTVTDMDADVAAWMATTPKYRFDLDRRGIGKKMEHYIKVGMPQEEVEQLMGAPQRSFVERPAYYYDLHTDSSVGIDFDDQGKVSLVRHIGT